MEIFIGSVRLEARLIRPDAFSNKLDAGSHGHDESEMTSTATTM